MKEKFRHLIGKRINEIILVIWPPYGEQVISQIDMKLGILLYNEKKMWIIGTSTENNWTPTLENINYPTNIFKWSSYIERMRLWMNCQINEPINNEFYEMSTSGLIDNIVGNEILDVQLLSLDFNNEPFGVQLIFTNDYILTTPNADGTSIETKLFNKNENLKNISSLGNINFNSI